MKETDTYQILEDSINVLIVEDEPIIAEDLSFMLEEMGIVGAEIVHSGEDAITAIDSKNYDLALLDINLDGQMDGLELAKLLEKKTGIPYLFLTSLSDSYTVNKVASLSPTAYLIKPIDEADLRVNIQLAIKRHKETPKTYPDVYYLKGKSKMTKVVTAQILYLEGSNNYTIMHTADKKHVISQTLKKVMNSLDPKAFIRVHKSAVVRLDKIDEIEDSHVKISNHSIPIGRTYRDILYSKLDTI